MVLSVPRPSLGPTKVGFCGDVLTRTESGGAWTSVDRAPEAVIGVVVVVVVAALPAAAPAIIMPIPLSMLFGGAKFSVFSASEDGF